MLLNRSDIFLKNDLLRGRGTDHFREPPQVGRVPSGPAGGAESVAPHKGLQTALGVFASPDGLCTRPGEVAPGCLWALGALDHREVACASQAGQLSSSSAVRCAPILGLLGHEGGRPHPAGVVFFPAIALEPGAAGTGFRDEDARLALGVELPDQLVAITLPGADSAEGDACCTRVWGDRGDRNGLLMPSHSDGERARRWHG